MRFVITGVTLTGNMGGSAMLHAAMQQLRARYPSASFQLLSIYPDADRACNQEQDLEVVSAPPLALMAWYMPLTFAAVLVPVLRRVLSRSIAFFRAIEQADAVVDLSGIAFVDGRGFPLLWYNTSCALPGIVWRKPVFKLSQALGPFRSRLNRLFARPVLTRCAAVIARGEQSRQFLEELGMSDPTALADVSFVLDISEQKRREAVEILRRLDDSARSWIIVSPSRVVASLCRGRGMEFLGEMSSFINAMLKDDTINVLILPHSLGRGASKNNDIQLCRSLYESVQADGRVFFHVPPEDPVLLRALIGEASFFVGCRFHAVVAALITSVPSLVLGWSHKYQEMAAEFDADIPILDFASFNAEALSATFREAWERRETTRARLQASGVKIKASSERNFELVEAYLRKAHEGK